MLSKHQATGSVTCLITNLGSCSTHVTVPPPVASPCHVDHMEASISLLSLVKTKIPPSLSVAIYNLLIPLRPRLPHKSFQLPDPLSQDFFCWVRRFSSDHFMVDVCHIPQILSDHETHWENLHSKKYPHSTYRLKTTGCNATGHLAQCELTCKQKA